MYLLVSLLVVLACSVGVLSGPFVINYSQREHDVDSFKFASYYGDSMVLQGAPLSSTVWGYSSKIGDTVTVTATPQSNPSGSVSVKVVVKKAAFAHEGGGVWLAKLPPVDASSNIYSVTAESSLGKISLDDVLFGDVWLCSGQSNMQFTLDMSFNGTAEMNSSSNYPNIRLMTVAMVESKTPLYDLSSIEELWTKPSADKVGHKEWTYFSAVCWLYGKYLHKKLGKPIGLVASDWGGTPDEAWSSPDALAKCGLDPTPSASERYDAEKSNGPQEHTVLWNAMIHPLLNMTIYGAIWYQGEANAARATSYNCSFPAMIDDWREKFHKGTQQSTLELFPFGFVQLAGNRENSTSLNFSQLRWAQTASKGYVPNDRMVNVFMAVAMDLPDFTSPYGSIHPRDKTDVGERLGLASLAVAYNQSSIIFQGPFPIMFAMVPEGREVVVIYNSNQKIAPVNNTEEFEVCCTPPCSSQNATWLPAPLTESKDYEVQLTHQAASCSMVHGIRYAWRESPCEFKACAIYGAKTALPGAPFQASFTYEEDELQQHKWHYRRYSESTGFQ